MPENETGDIRSPTWFLILFDTIIIGIAISFGIENIATNYTTIGVVNVTSFFLAAINFYHGKLTNISDADYQSYADKRRYLAVYADFFIHIITLLTFGFMPFFLHNIKGYLICHIALRFSDIALTMIVFFTVRSVSLSKNKITEIRNIQRDWFIIDLVVAIFAGIFLYLVLIKEGCYIIQLLAAIVILLLGILDILTDYILHREHYFGERPK